MKTCSRCGMSKAEESFLKGNRCKTCREDDKRFYEDNKEAKAAYKKSYRRRNKEFLAIQGKRYYEANKETIASTNKIYRKENKEIMDAISAKRRAAERMAVPPWFSLEHQHQIREIYNRRNVLIEATTIQYQVDHIVPLQGKNVCGLHVPWNLQIITAKENLSKGNSYSDDDAWEEN